MKKIHVLILSAIFAGICAIPAFAATETTQARVIKVTGGVQVILPGRTEPVTPAVGMMLPQGASIVTSAGAELDVQTISGSLTTIRQNTTVTLDELSVSTDAAGAVTKQTALIGLKAGNVISTLDPTKKAINNYGVRTPKGVAAARGTAYSVTFDFNSSTTSVATLSGTVTLTPTDGGPPIVIDLGTGVVLSDTGSATPRTIAEIVAAETNAGTAGSDGSISQAIDATVQAVANAVASGTVDSSAGATALLASVVSVASQANPANAANYTATAVAAATSPNAATRGSTSTVTAIAEAAAQGAARGASERGGTVDTSAIVNAASSADKNPVKADTTTLNDAVNTGASTGSSGGTSSPNQPIQPSTPITPVDPSTLPVSPN